MILAVAGYSFAGGKKEVSTEKILKVGVPDVARFLDPTANMDNVVTRVVKNFHATLIEVDENGKIVPSLAESWNQIDDRTVEFRLRKGVVSHAGHPLNADDVLVSFGPGRTQNAGDPGHDIFKQYTGEFESVTKIDDYTVRFKKAAPDPLLLLRFTVETSVIICGDSYKAKNSWEEWYRKPVGFGPYYVSAYKPAEILELKKFNDYYGEKAPVDTIRYIVIPEMAPRVMGLVSGDYDIITEVMPDQFATIERNKDYEVTGGPINNIRILIYDVVASPVLKDPRIRRALNYSIDRELINNTIFKGLTEIPQGIQMKEFGEMYVGEFKPVGFNPQKAKELLKEAGYNGEEISYRYMQDYYTGEVATAQILQQMWADVGLNVKLELKENWDQIETPQAAPGRAIINWSGTAIFWDPLSQIARLFGPAGFFQVNNMWKNDEFNRLFEVVNGTDKAARRKAVARMLEIVENEDPSGTYLYRMPNFYGISKKIEWKPGNSHYMDFRAGKLAK